MSLTTFSSSCWFTTSTEIFSFPKKPAALPSSGRNRPMLDTPMPIFISSISEKFFVSLSVSRLTANGRNRDMRHRRIRLRAVPVPFAGFDMHDVADGYLALFPLRRDHASAGRHHQDLITVVGMPSGSRTFAEVHHIAAKVLGLSVTDDRLPRPADRPSSPSGNGRGAVHGFLRQVIYFEYAHIHLLFFPTSLVAQSRTLALAHDWT